MDKLLNIHKILLAILLIVIALLLGIYLMLLRPALLEEESVIAETEELRSRMSGKWPLDALRLEKHLKTLTAELAESAKTDKNAAANATNQALELFDRTHREKIKTDFGDTEEFIKGASRVDFQSEFERIMNLFQKDNIWIDKTTFGVSVDMEGSFNYQYLMHLWTAEKLVALAKEFSLNVVADGRVVRGGKNPQRCAHIFLKPVKAYFEKPDVLQPYLIEFPVEIKLTGKVSDCLFFLAQLDSDTVFLPAMEFEFEFLPPLSAVGDTQGQMIPGNMNMCLKCSSFLILNSGKRGI